MTNWSEYQTAVFNFVRNETGNGVVLARAGSGKTSTIVEACACTKPTARVLFVAFNKTIADELAQRVPGNTTASTLHSFGFKAVKAAWGRRAELKKDKERDLAQRILPRDADAGDVTNLCKLVSMAKAWLAYDAPDLNELAEEYECTSDRFSEEQWAGFAQFILDESKRPELGVSFDDMVWLPVALKLPVVTYDMVFVDETQDLNRAQAELVMRATGKAGRVIAVGDDRQSIYTFRGADSASIERIIERLSATTMPLSITYRCPRAVVALAQRFVPDLQAAEGAAEGVVRTVHGSEIVVRSALPGDAIISRTNAPLVRLTLALLRAGKRAAMRGRDVGAGIAKLIRKAKTNSITDFAAWLTAYETRERTRLIKAGKEDRVEELADRVETIHALSEGCATVAELLTRIESLFDDAAPNGSRILLSSTHKAKGLEWDRVWLLWDTYRPSGVREEQNLCYVAITRAKAELVIVEGVKK